jgi:hypothetical protein
MDQTTQLPPSFPFPQRERRQSRLVNSTISAAVLHNMSESPLLSLPVRIRHLIFSYVDSPLNLSRVSNSFRLISKNELVRASWLLRHPHHLVDWADKRVDTRPTTESAFANLVSDIIPSSTNYAAPVKPPAVFPETLLSETVIKILTDAIDLQRLKYTVDSGDLKRICQSLWSHICTHLHHKLALNMIKSATLHKCESSLSVMKSGSTADVDMVGASQSSMVKSTGFGLNSPSSLLSPMTLRKNAPLLMVMDPLAVSEEDFRDDNDFSNIVVTSADGNLMPPMPVPLGQTVIKVISSMNIHEESEDLMTVEQLDEISWTEIMYLSIFMHRVDSSLLDVLLDAKVVTEDLAPDAIELSTRIGDVKLLVSVYIPSTHLPTFLPFLSLPNQYYSIQRHSSSHLSIFLLGKTRVIWFPIDSD